MGRPTLQNQVKSKLISITRLGESRHLAKEEAKQEYAKTHDKMNITEIRVDTIHSINTFNTYMQHCNAFINWCIEEKGINKNIKLDKIEYLAKEYLQYRESEGKSLYTLKSEKAALGKLYQHEIDYKFKDKRSYDKITRSRNESVKDKHFSEEKNKDLVNIAKGTGGRREDLSKLTPSNFFTDKNNNLWVKFEQSKGGRDRIAPVLPKYEKEIKDFIKDKPQKEKLFDHINTNADIHSYRREYTKNLYELVKNDKDKREEYAKMYPLRAEKVKGDMYISHNKENQFKGKRDDIYICTQALGHNRLEITVNHYLK